MNPCMNEKYAACKHAEDMARAAQQRLARSVPRQPGRMGTAVCARWQQHWRIYLRYLASALFGAAAWGPWNAAHVDVLDAAVNSLALTGLWLWLVVWLPLPAGVKERS
jgi:hypothetical protein